MKLNTPELLSLGGGQEMGQRMGRLIFPSLRSNCLVVPREMSKLQTENWHKLFSPFTLNFEILCFRMLSVKIQKTAERLTHQGTLNTKTRAGTAAQGILKLLQGCIRGEISLYRHYFLNPCPGFSHLAIAGDQIHENIWGKKILSSNILICAIYPVF